MKNAKPAKPAAAPAKSLLLFALPLEVAASSAPVEVAPPMVAVVLENSTVVEPPTSTPLVAKLTAALLTVLAAPLRVIVMSPITASVIVLPCVVISVSTAVKTTPDATVMTAIWPVTVDAF